MHRDVEPCLIVPRYVKAERGLLRGASFSTGVSGKGTGAGAAGPEQVGEIGQGELSAQAMPRAWDA